jgi:hypothetical protein
MKTFEQVENLFIKRTYTVTAKNEDVASSLIENRDKRVNKKDETLEVKKCRLIKEVV